MTAAIRNLADLLKDKPIDQSIPKSPLTYKILSF